MSLRSEGVGSPDFDRISVVAGIFDSDNFGRSILPDHSLLVAYYQQISFFQRNEMRCEELSKNATVVHFSNVMFRFYFRPTMLP